MAEVATGDFLLSLSRGEYLLWIVTSLDNGGEIERVLGRCAYGGPHTYTFYRTGGGRVFAIDGEEGLSAVEVFETKTEAEVYARIMGVPVR